MSAVVLTTQDSNVQSTVTTKQSKQSRYYYRHRTERLRYQRDYYNNHKPTILTNKQQRTIINKVQRTKNNISLLPKIRVKSYGILKNLDRTKFMDAYFHSHGRPKGKRIYAKPRRRFWFHVSPDLAYINGQPFLLLENCQRKDITTFHKLVCELAHCLGFQVGDSLTWKETNAYTGKVETHVVCFDRSGIDLSHDGDLMRLTEFRIEHDVKGYDMMHLFVNKYGFNGYLQIWKGTQLIRTSENENALRDYRKYFPYDPEKEFEQKINRELKEAWRYAQKEN